MQAFNWQEYKEILGSRGIIGLDLETTGINRNIERGIIIQDCPSCGHPNHLKKLKDRCVDGLYLSLIHI